MSSFEIPNTMTWKLPAGLIAGLGIAALDTFGLKGQTDPASVRGLLFLFGFLSGFLWDWRGWPASLLAWLCLPLAQWLIPLLNPGLARAGLSLETAALSLGMVAAGTLVGFLFKRLGKVTP